jgi:hypothetical protein
MVTARSVWTRSLDGGLRTARRRVGTTRTSASTRNDAHAFVAHPSEPRVIWSVWPCGWFGSLGAVTVGNGGVRARQVCTGRTFGPMSISRVRRSGDALGH